MKKLITAVVLVATMFIARNVQAQFSVNLGYAPEAFTTKATTTTLPASGGTPVTNYYETKEAYQGFFIGATYNFKLVENFGIAVGGQFRWNRQNKSNTVLGSSQSRHIENQFLIDVPLMLNYNIELNRDWHITPFIGPMLSWGLGGNIKDINLDGATEYSWYDSPYMITHPYKRLNLYAAGGAALGYKHFKLFAGYRHGLIDLCHYDEVKTYTSGLFVGLGYTF